LVFSGAARSWARRFSAFRYSRPRIEASACQTSQRLFGAACQRSATSALESMGQMENQFLHQRPRHGCGHRGAGPADVPPEFRCLCRLIPGHGRSRQTASSATSTTCRIGLPDAQRGGCKSLIRGGGKGFTATRPSGITAASCLTGPICPPADHPPKPAAAPCAAWLVRRRKNVQYTSKHNRAASACLGPGSGEALRTEYRPGRPDSGVPPKTVPHPPRDCPAPATAAAGRRSASSCPAALRTARSW
jgi:hypothetical protein